MYKVDLSYTWKYWEEHILPIVQEFGAYKSHIRRLGEYEFEYRCGKEAWKFELAVLKKMEELLGIDSWKFIPLKSPRHSRVDSKGSTLSSDWKDIGLNFGPGGIRCACCAPPSAERKAEFRSRFRMNNKKIIQNELKEFNISKEFDKQDRIADEIAFTMEKMESDDWDTSCVLRKEKKFERMNPDFWD